MKPLTLYRQHADQNTGVNLKQSSIEALFLNLSQRLSGKNTPKLIASREQYQNLLSIEKHLFLDSENQKSLNDFLNFYDDYVKNFIHINHFIIGLKYHKIIRPAGDMFFLKNIFKDIVG